MADPLDPRQLEGWDQPIWRRSEVGRIRGS